MKLKNNSGVTITVLVCTVIILVILAAVSINVGSNLIDKAKFENVKTDLLLIQSKCKVKAEQKAIGEIKEEELYGVKQTEGTYNGWYLLSQDDLNNMGIEDIDVSSNYYVNYEQGDVAYGEGIVNDNKTYYKLSEMLND